MAVNDNEITKHLVVMNIILGAILGCAIMLVLFCELILVTHA